MKTIDRDARNQMKATLRAYMDDRLTSFQLADKTMNIAGVTKDETVNWIADDLWYYYDDIIDHKIVASKEVWDYFNRLLLLLESDGELEVIKDPRQWNWSNIVAGVGLIIFLLIVFIAGFFASYSLLIFPCALLSMILSWFNRRADERAFERSKPMTIPFASIGNLLSIRRQVTGFVRTKYPKVISKRKVWSSFSRVVLWLPTLFAWLIVSPIILLFQMIPVRQNKIRITEPKSGAERDNPRI